MRNVFFWYKNEFKNSIFSELKSSGRDDLVKKLFR